MNDLGFKNQVLYLQTISIVLSCMISHPNKLAYVSSATFLSVSTASFFKYIYPLGTRVYTFSEGTLCNFTHFLKECTFYDSQNSLAQGGTLSELLLVPNNDAIPRYNTVPAMPDPNKLHRPLRAIR